MPQEVGKNPLEDSEGQDTDEQFQDHPELAPPEGRISVEKVKNLDDEARRRGLAGDAVEDAGDRQRKIELNFGRNNDFAGNEMSQPTDADYSRGSGFIGGRLVGEGPAGEDRHVDTHSEGFDLSEDQVRNIDAIRREEEESVGDWSAHPPDPGSAETQGRDILKPQQATATQAFGRDIGSSGLSEEERDGHTFSPGKPHSAPEHKIWAAVLRRLGGGSPGSEENLQLSELFSRVQFPADREGVISRLAPGAEFRLREGIIVDLHHAVERSRTKTFRNLGDLVDCVKDELRRQEADGLKLLRMT